MTVEIGGSVEPGFEAVRDVMVANFEDRGEVGASAAAYIDGKQVFNIWAGEAQPGVSWKQDTVVTVYSTTKGATALVIQLLADRGKLDVTKPVAHYWAEFAQNSKEGVSVEHVLTHTSGLIRVTGYAELLKDHSFVGDLDRVAAKIAEAELDFEPGSQVGYQAVTYGFILGELVRRVDGRSLGTVWREEIADPFDIDFHIGLGEQQHQRTAKIIDAPMPPEAAVQFYLAMFTPHTIQGQAMMVGDGGMMAVADQANLPHTLSAEIPAAGGVGSANSIARWYAILANNGELEGRRLVSTESIEDFSRERVAGQDMVGMLESRFGLGYALPTALSPYASVGTAFGHSGLGGSVGFADPKHRISFGYAMNQLRFPNLNDASRAERFIKALYRSL